jgi:hypothetical protein
MLRKCSHLAHIPIMGDCRCGCVDTEKVLGPMALNLPGSQGDDVMQSPHLSSTIAALDIGSFISETSGLRF